MVFLLSINPRLFLYLNKIYKILSIAESSSGESGFTPDLKVETTLPFLEIRYLLKLYEENFHFNR